MRACARVCTCVCACECVRASVCVGVCVIASVCVHVRAVCSESIKDVTVKAKNNFGDTLDAMYNIACARSVSENVGLLLKNSYVVSLCSFLAMPLSRVDMQLQWIFGTQKRGVRTP